LVEVNVFAEEVAVDLKGIQPLAIDWWIVIVQCWWIWRRRRWRW